MNTFAPPGYIALVDLLQLAGQALLKDDWLGAVEPPDDAAVRREVERKEHLAQALRAAGRGRPGPVISTDFAARFAKLEDIRKRREAQRDKVIAALRTPLCTGAIASVIKKPSGVLVAIPAHFWQGDDALAALLFGTATVAEHAGQVLFTRASAETWLQEARGAVMRMISEDDARDWLVARATSGTAFAGGKSMWSELQQELDGRISRDRFDELRKAVMDEFNVSEPSRGRPTR